MECPKCSSTSVHRSRRKGAIERGLLGPLAVLPYRCTDCNARFHRMQRDRLAHKLSDLLSNPPVWIRAIGWLVLITAIAIVIGFFVARTRR